jgi:hypothetical protein
MGRASGQRADAGRAGRADRFDRRLNAVAIAVGAGGALLAAGLLVAGVGCLGEDGAERAQPAVPTGVSLQAVPPRALGLCLGRTPLRAGCPRRVPRARGYAARIIPRDGLGYATLDLHVSWPYGDPRRNRPPRFVHVVVEGGDVEAGFEFPRVFRPGGLEGVLRRSRVSGLVLGERRWGGRTGTLLLAPSFDRSSTIHGDHLLFVWREHGLGHLVSLHAWEPIGEAVLTLRAMVESTPRS